MLDKIQSFYGFTRMPYGRNLAPGMLHQYADHAQAAARIAYGINTRGITVRHQMIGMTADETAGYIRHHLALAGRSDPIFTDDAIALIHTSSRGKPRSVNNLAIAALIAARAKDKTLVDEASARSAITETTDRLVASP